ncbi:MAG: hypothetical protein ACI4WS_08630 [Oscillospiraceae bacterium]
MANGSKHGGIEGADKSAKATVGAGVAIAGGIAAALVGSAINASNKKKAEQERQEKIEFCKSQISICNSKIADLRSDFLGSVLNSDEIAYYEDQRSKYQAELNRLIRG